MKYGQPNHCVSSPDQRTLQCGTSVESNALSTATWRSTSAVPFPLHVRRRQADEPALGAAVLATLKPYAKPA